MSATRATREEKLAQILELRDQGLSYGQIASEVGISRTMIYYLVNPDYAERSREQSRAAKRRRTGTCAKCGRPTRYSGERGVAVSTLCAECGSAQGGATAKEATQGNGPTQERLRAILDAGPLRFTEIAERLGIGKGTAAALLHRTLESGWLERPARGVYRLTDQG